MLYELLYIVPTRYTDVEVADIQKRVSDLVAKSGGTVKREEMLGKIRLAYPIKSQRHGTYVLSVFDAEPAVISTLEHELRLSTEVLRHLITQTDVSALTRPVEIQAYVAPLSEEEGETRPVRQRSAPIMAPVAAPVATPMKPETSMSIEELDKKLDEILREDVV